MATSPSYDLTNLVQLASDPGSGMGAGDAYFNTSIGMPRGYNGSVWLTLPLLGASVQAVLGADVAISQSGWPAASTSWADVGIQIDLSAVPSTGTWKLKIMGVASWVTKASATGVNVLGATSAMQWRLVDTGATNEAVAVLARFVGVGANVTAVVDTRYAEAWITSTQIPKIYKLQHRVIAADGVSTFTTTNTTSISTHGGAVNVTPTANFDPHPTWIAAEQVAA